MSILGYVKEKWQERQKASKERKAYQQILGEKTKAVARQAYAKESVHQAQLKAIRDAKEAYSPNAKSSGFGSGIKNMLGEMSENWQRSSRAEPVFRPPNFNTEQSNPSGSFGRGSRKQNSPAFSFRQPKIETPQFNFKAPEIEQPQFGFMQPQSRRRKR